MLRTFALCLILSLTASAEAIDYEIREAGRIAVPKPAFQSLLESEGNSLVVSSFGLTGKDHVYRIANPWAAAQGGTPRIETITDAIIWPNEVRLLGPEALGQEGWLISSGFLFPPKSTGAISYLDLGGKLSQLTLPKTGWFYHRAVVADVTGTGRMDIITARGTIPPIGAADGELVWLQRPPNPLDSTWNEVVLAKGPDIHFRVVRNPADGALVIIAAEFSGKKISIHWLEGSQARSRVIDNTLGSAFDLDTFDLNGDGRLDLLATNHENQEEKSAVLAYTMPDNLKTGAWRRYVLFSGIKTTQPGIQQASPGAAKAFFPNTSDTSGKPWIVVSGDGSQRAYLLRPLSESATNWDYESRVILDAGATTGEPIAHDFDGDGLADFAIPAYDKDTIHLLSLKTKAR